ncbi:hypothetical protein, partial [Enterococcus avium]
TQKTPEMTNESSFLELFSETYVTAPYLFAVKARTMSIFFVSFSHRVYAQRVLSNHESGEEPWSRKN